MVKLTLYRSDAMFDNDEMPLGTPDKVEIGPYEWVQQTYEHLRISPEGDFIGGFKDGRWWLEGEDYPFSDIVIEAVTVTDD